MIYRENCWPSKEPTGSTYKSKKSIFIKAGENLKLQISKKLNDISFGNIACKILDFKNVNYGMEYEVKIIKGKDRGNALLKIFGPNNKKDYTIQIIKVKKNDMKFAEILAKDFVKELLDRFGSGENWEDLVISSSKKITKKKAAIKCDTCKKTFCS